MARWKPIILLTSLAVVLALTACGAEPTQRAKASAEVDTTEAEAAEPTAPKADDPDENGSNGQQDGGVSDDAVPPADAGGDPGSEFPWHLLPENDRPQPLDQPVCETAGSTPVLC